jgi:hypothetical protein
MRGVCLFREGLARREGKVGGGADKGVDADAGRRVGGRGQIGWGQCDQTLFLLT